jgi:hypothetical protein
MTTTLPEQLRYLESTLRQLAKIPAEELDEEVVDVSMLEGALRNRIRGLSIRQAQERIKEDCKVLEGWLKNSGEGDGFGQWVVAFLSYRPGSLARRLLAPPEVLENLPKISFEPPDGWTFEPVPLSLHLLKGRKKMGAVTSIDASSLARMLHKNEFRDGIPGQSHNPLALPIPIVGKWTKSSVQFGEVRGHKFLYNQTAPVAWKSVQYLLEVPGGSVNIMLDDGGKNFDETDFEAKLHTLRITKA